MNVNELIEIIADGRSRISKLVFHNEAFLPYYDYSNMDDYYTWLSKATRYLNINFPGDKEIKKFETLSEERITPTQQNKLLAMLEAFATYPDVVKTDTKESGGINIVNTQSQSQSQEYTNIFIEAIKDELTGKQQKELQSIVADTSLEENDKRTRIISKLKEFGENIMANIVANIVTNPNLSFFCMI